MKTVGRRPSRRALLKLTASAIVLPVAAACAPRASPPPEFRIIPRAEWGAAEPDFDAPGEHGLYDPVANREGWLVYEQPLNQVLMTIIVHHSALPPRDGPKAIQSLHMRQKGFADIGYHFLIDDAGQVYEGRSIRVRGAHTGGHNTGTVGVALLGNFEETAPAPFQLTILKILVRHLADEYGMTHLAGHMDFQPDVTVCPGKNLEPLLPDLAKEASLEFGTGGYDGP